MNKLLSAAWNVRGLSGAEKLVLVNLADRADNSGKCWPSHERICGDCAIADRTLRKILPVLQEKGHITIKREKYRSSKGGSVFDYMVHPVTPTPAQGATVTPASGANDTGITGSRHRHYSAPTPALGASPILTISNPQEPSEEPKRTPRGLAHVDGGMLSKDLDRINKQIDQEKNKPQSDSDFLNGLREQRDEIKNEIAARGRARNKATNRDDKSTTASASRNDGTYNEGTPTPDLNEINRRRQERARAQTAGKASVPPEQLPETKPPMSPEETLRFFEKCKVDSGLFQPDETPASTQ